MKYTKKLLFSTRGSLNLAQEIAKELNKQLNDIKFINFSDGEYSLSLNEKIYGKKLFIIGSTHPPVDNLMEILLICDAAKRSLAKEINLIIPYFGWGRQDRQDKKNSPISAKLIANMITCSGVSNIITIDLHSDQIQGFFDIPVKHIYSFNMFINYIKNKNLDNLIFASPDIGGVKRARTYASKFGTDIIICYKERKQANEINFMNIIGEAKNKDVIIIDDMVDTAGTLTKAADLIKRMGAKSVRAIATHAILSGNSIEKIKKSPLEELITTNTVPIKEDYEFMTKNKIKILTCAPIFKKFI